MRMESQAARVTDELHYTCNSVKDCYRQHYHCPSGLIVICAVHHCSCIH